MKHKIILNFGGACAKITCNVLEDNFLKKRKRKKRRLRRLLFWIVVCLLIAAVYNSSHKLEVTEYSAASERLPAEFDGFKIVQLSDLHGADFGDELYEKVREQSPDIIVLTGDFITTGDDLAVVDKLTSKLSALTDVYYISGNHDYGSGEIQALTEILERNGVRFLRNEYEFIERDGAHIIVSGVEDPNSWAEMTQPDELEQSIADAYPDTYNLLLGHRNYWVQEYPELPVDLILCGHTHGGIIRLPGVGGLLSTDRTMFPEYEAGEYFCGQYEMIVSRGLGNSISIPRMFNLPEIVSVTLHTK